jgi:hypothetical protein
MWEFPDAINEAAVTELAEPQASSLIAMGPAMGPGDRIFAQTSEG